MAVLLLAGIGKFLDLATFAAALQKWQTLPDSVRPAIVAVLPAAEVFIALCWLLRLAPRGACWGAMGLISLFTAAYLVEWLAGGPPACGCMGRIAAGGFLDTAAGVLGRNGLLLGLLVAGMWSRRGTMKTPAACDAVVADRSRSSRDRTIASSAARGFTILEVLVVMIIVAVVTALALPALSRMRERSAEVQQLAYMRQNAQAFVGYTVDYRGVYPYLTDPSREFSTLRCVGSGVEEQVRYLDVWNLWSIGLADDYYGGDAMSVAFQGRDYRIHGKGLTASVLYPSVFLARPEYWNRETRTSLSEQVGTTSDADVVFASKKILLGEFLPDRIGESRLRQHPDPVAFTDGHAQTIAWNRDLTPRGPGVAGYPRYQSIRSLWLLDFFWTLDGVRGRDVR